MRRPPIHLRAWRPGDEVAFTPRPDFAAEAQALAWDWSQGAPGPTWTVMRWPAEVIGVGGAVRRGGRWQAWALLAPCPPRDWPLLLDCARAAIAHLAAVRRFTGPRKLTALCRVGWPPAERVLKRLGFSRSEIPNDWPAYRTMTRAF